MKWSYLKLSAKRDKLDPELRRVLGVYQSVVDGSLTIWAMTDQYRHTYFDFTEGDEMFDIFMASSKFDRGLYILLTHTFGISAKAALEICLS